MAVRTIMVGMDTTDLMTTGAQRTSGGRAPITMVIIAKLFILPSWPPAASKTRTGGQDGISSGQR